MTVETPFWVLRFSFFRRFITFSIRFIAYLNSFTCIFWLRPESAVLARLWQNVTAIEFIKFFTLPPIPCFTVKLLCITQHDMFHKLAVEYIGILEFYASLVDKYLRCAVSAEFMAIPWMEIPDAMVFGWCIASVATVAKRTYSEMWLGVLTVNWTSLSCRCHPPVLFACKNLDGKKWWFLRFHKKATVNWWQRNYRIVAFRLIKLIHW